MSNLQKYHVSKNLLEYYVDGLIAADGTLSTSQSYQTYFAPVIAGETYTLGSNIDVFGYFDSKPVIGTVTNDGTRHFYSQTQSGVITIPNNSTAWIGCRVRTDADAMFNLGSYALPYEPYSADVWHDLAPQQRINGVFVDNANIPEKYSGGSWS